MIVIKLACALAALVLLYDAKTCFEYSEPDAGCLAIFLAGCGIFGAIV